MDPRDQARLLSLEYGGQNFGNNNASGYDAGANIAPLTAQRVDWYNRGNATNNGSVTLPATYSRQPGTNGNFSSPRRDPTSPATQELNTLTENPRILDPALLSSFLEHTRREGPTANACAACNASFQTNKELESHARNTHHSAFLCACDTSFGRRSSLDRHINSNTGTGYHCELCEDKTLPRMDKLYDHLRDGHKVSQTVLDKYRNKALGRARKPSRSIRPAPASATTRAATTQVAPSIGFGPSWSPAGQVNGMASRHPLNMTPSTSNGVNPAHLTTFTDTFNF